jgi:hypothetical protein
MNTSTPPRYSVRRLPPGVRLAVHAMMSLVLLSLVAVSAAAQRAPTGRFEIRRGTGGSVELSFKDRDGDDRGGTSFSVEPNALHGLTADQLDDSYSGAIRFTLVRDAGTITFDGKASGGEGNGSYAFTPTAAYASNLAERGIGRPTETEQFQLALHDVGYPLLDELRTQRYPTPSIAELVRMGMHGVDTEYVHDMGALHYQLGTVAVLIKFRDHGVDPDFVNELRKAGYTTLAPGELLKLKDHGVDGDFVDDLTRVGFTGLTPAELLLARDHGVSASFIAGIRRAGYTGFSIAEYVRLRDHGVTASFAKRMRDRTSTAPSAQDLVRAMDHGGDDGD